MVNRVNVNDIGWNYATPFEGNFQTPKCNFCNKVFLGGGVTRLKEHLGVIIGNTYGCPSAPQEVRQLVRAYMIKKKSARDKRKLEKQCLQEKLMNIHQPEDSDGDEGETEDDRDIRRCLQASQETYRDEHMHRSHRLSGVGSSQMERNIHSKSLRAEADFDTRAVGRIDMYMQKKGAEEAFQPPQILSSNLITAKKKAMELDSANIEELPLPLLKLKYIELENNLLLERQKYILLQSELESTKLIASKHVNIYKDECLRLKEIILMVENNYSLLLKKTKNPENVQENVTSKHERLEKSDNEMVKNNTKDTELGNECVIIDIESDSNQPDSKFDNNLRSHENNLLPESLPYFEVESPGVKEKSIEIADVMDNRSLGLTKRLEYSSCVFYSSSETSYEDGETPKSQKHKRKAKESDSRNTDDTVVTSSSKRRKKHDSTGSFKDRSDNSNEDEDELNDELGSKAEPKEKSALKSKSKGTSTSKSVSKEKTSDMFDRVKGTGKGVSSSSGSQSTDHEDRTLVSPLLKTSSSPSSVAGCSSDSLVYVYATEKGTWEFSDSIKSDVIRDGILVRITDFWSKFGNIPIQLKDVMFEEFKRKFHWVAETPDQHIRLAWNAKASLKYREWTYWMHKNKKKHESCPQEVYAQFESFWETSEFKVRSVKSQANRLTNRKLHTDDSKTYADYKSEMQAEANVVPTAGEVYCKTHKTSTVDGSDDTFVDGASIQFSGRIANLEAAGTLTTTEQFDAIFYEPVDTHSKRKDRKPFLDNLPAGNKTHVEEGGDEEDEDNDGDDESEGDE